MNTPECDPMPVFTLKAKDQFTVPTVEYYNRLCRAHGLYDQVIENDKALAELRAWETRNSDRMKLPDHKHVPTTGE